MDTTGRHPRVVLALLAASSLVTGVVVAAGLVGVGPGPRTSETRASAAVRAAVRPEARAAALLHAWDVRRARAWAGGDLAALRRLYVPGSRAGERDAAMLRAWNRRGLRVRDLTTQLLDVRVRDASEDRLVLAVTDRVSGRVAGAAARPGGARMRLPTDRPSRRVVVLERQAGRWRVAAVRPGAQPEAQPGAQPAR